jgi:hypothetical protein
MKCGALLVRGMGIWIEPEPLTLCCGSSWCEDTITLAVATNLNLIHVPPVFGWPGV